jgi:hypothetical protein
MFFLKRTAKALPQFLLEGEIEQMLVWCFEWKPR